VIPDGALAGAGFFAQFHADAWARIPGARLRAVADPDLERARAFAAKWGIPKAYARVDQMLDREKPAFLDIATRPETHRELAAQAASRGVHVLCQKPLAPDWAESAAIVEDCRAAKVRLLVHENWRWQPWYREIRRLLDDGSLGRAFHTVFTMRTGDGRGPEPYPVQPYFRKMPRFLLQETGVHFLDTWRFLLGEIRSVSCRLERLNPLIEGEDYALVQADFEGGAHGIFDANRLTGPVPAPTAMATFRLETDRAVLLMDAEGGITIADPGGPARVHEYARPTTGYKGDSVLATCRHQIECLVSGKPGESEGAAYLKTVAAVEACYRSARSGRPERPGEEPAA
jgi:predicted dehydrogenase